MQSARGLDERHGISQAAKCLANDVIITAKNVADTSKKAVDLAMNKANDVNEKHRLTERAKDAARVATDKGALGANFVSQFVKQQK